MELTAADRDELLDTAGESLELLSRRGTLEPEETPGGGLTMTVSVPAASRTTHRHSLPASHVQPGSEEAAR
jgi:hypothetical protein